MEKGTKRLTFNIPAELHTAIKIACARVDEPIGTVLRKRLEEEYGTSQPRAGRIKVKEKAVA